MRVYLPATSTTLTVLLNRGVLGPAPITAFAVTPGLREWYVDDDIEELEYSAMLEAAHASLRMLSNDETAVRARAVVSADVEDSLVEVHDDLDRGVVRVLAEVTLAQCASVHCDDRDAREVVSRAAEVIDAADLGEPAAEELVDDADGFELSWYATQELQVLLDSLT